MELGSKLELGSGEVFNLNDRLKETIFYKLCNLYNKNYINNNINNGLRFPGPLPKSLEREFFPKFKNPYHVCEKSNGVRYLFFSTMYKIDDQDSEKPCCFLINRKNDVYLLQLSLPSTTFQNTILDGELIQSKNSTKWYFLIFDVVMINGIEMQKKTFSTRIQSSASIVDSYKQTNTDIFQFKTKNFIEYNPSDFRKYVEITVPQLDYDTDGYIFTPEYDEITSGTHENMFKLKSQMDNSVDFEIRYFDNRFSLWLCNRCVKNNHIDITNNKKEISILNGVKHSMSRKMIVECQLSRVHENGRDRYWIPLLIRGDKSHSNSFYTFSKTLKNIEENIQLEEFFENIV